MGQIAEELFTERVVAQILNYTAAVRICVCFAECVFCDTRIARDKQRLNGDIPGQIN